jgi:hypothetical protein
MCDLEVRLVKCEEYLRLLHSLVNDLGEIAGYERNNQTSANITPNHWTRAGRDKNKVRDATLEPTGRLKFKGDYR